jgi:hypothetical protein
MSVHVRNPSQAHHMPVVDDTPWLPVLWTEGHSLAYVNCSPLEEAL